MKKTFIYFCLFYFISLLSFGQNIQNEIELIELEQDNITIKPEKNVFTLNKKEFKIRLKINSDSRCFYIFNFNDNDYLYKKALQNYKFTYENNFHAKFMTSDVNEKEIKTLYISQEGLAYYYFNDDNNFNYHNVITKNNDKYGEKNIDSFFIDGKAIKIDSKNIFIKKNYYLVIFDVLLDKTNKKWEYNILKTIPIKIVFK